MNNSYNSNDIDNRTNINNTRYENNNRTSYKSCTALNNRNSYKMNSAQNSDYRRA